MAVNRIGNSAGKSPVIGGDGLADTKSLAIDETIAHGKDVAIDETIAHGKDVAGDEDYATAASDQDALNRRAAFQAAK